MRVIDALSSPGGENNEDLISYGDNYVLLLDGSTGLKRNRIPGYASDAIWFVNEVSKYIGESIAQNADTFDMINNLISNVNQKYAAFHLGDADRVEMPSASLVLIRENADNIEILNIGDCTTVMETKSGDIEVIHDSRVTDLDNKVVEKMKTISARRNITISQAREYVTEDLISNRDKKNVEGGYQVIGFEPICRADFMIQTYPLDEIETICAFSDGAADHYESLKQSENVFEFYNMIKKSNLRNVLDEIRTCQNNDLSCSLHPRLKPKDDASIVLVRPALSMDSVVK